MMSWPRSPIHFDIGSDDAGDVDHLYPSPPSESEASVHPGRFATSVPPFFDSPTLAYESDSVSSEPAKMNDTGELWECFKCSAVVHRWSDDRECWVCCQCGSAEIYNAKQPSKQQATHGTWIYVPNALSAPESLNDEIRSLQSQPPSFQTKHKPGPPSRTPEGGEHAESETATNDPSVDPVTLEPLPSRRRRRRQRHEDPLEQTCSPPMRPQTIGSVGKHKRETPTNEPNTDNLSKEILQALRSIVKDKKSGDSSAASWNSRQGPEKHVKWRGGTPPSPPAWKPQANDLRAFSRWERRIEIWQLQIKPYMNDADAALMLMTSLSGEAELEVEHLDLKRVHHKDGIRYILDVLREPLQQKQLFQKRNLLSSYETVSRHQGESLRQFINRYRRIGKDLEAIGITTASMYDSESKGNRLLERAKLAPDMQRLVIIAAGNSLHYEQIQNALCLQFPDFRPAPPVFYSGGGNRAGYSGKQNGSSSSASGSTYASSNSSSNSFAGKSSKGSGKHPGKRAFITDHEGLPGINEEEQAEIENDPEVTDADEFQDPEEQNQGEDVQEQEDDAGFVEVSDVVNELAQVLTVTSKKLQSTVLGRKFSGRPRTIEERKKTSSCTACGQMGHWKGDAACPQSSDAAKSNGKGRAQQQPRDGKGGPASSASHKRSFMVRFPEQDPQAQQETYMDNTNETTNIPTTNTSYFTFMNTFNFSIDHTNYVTELIDFSGYMVLDTACQRSCCGTLWMNTHTKILDKFHLKTKTIPTIDVFQFGSGGPKKALYRTYMPTALEGQETQGLLLGVSVVQAEVPFLASNTLLEKLGCTIDMFDGFVHFHVLGVKLPLVYKHGHIAVKITCFPPNISRHEVWNQLSSAELWHDPDPEVLFSPALSAQRDRLEQSRLRRPYAGIAPTVASVMEADCDQSHASGVPMPCGNVPTCETWTSTEKLADELGGKPDERGTSTRDGREDQDLRPSDLHPSGLPPIRQQERQLRPVQALHEEVPLGRRSRRMAPGWRSVLIAICALATSLLGEHSASEDHFHDIEDGIHTQATCQSQEQKQSDTWTGSFTSLGDRTGGGHLEHDVIGSVGTSRPRGRRCLSGLGGSRQISELDLRLQLKKDHWEVQKGYCIRHHLVPRHELFDVLKVDCPVPLTKLHPICSVEMEYDDGKFTAMEYEWGRALVTPPISSVWTGRTIFSDPVQV